MDYIPHAVVHLGACASTTQNNADYLMENNYRFSRILVEWAISKNIRFLYASSAATYGSGENGFSDESDLSILRPLNMYGYSKHFFDLYAERSGLLGKITGVKFFNVFGPNEYHKGDMTSAVFKAFHQVIEDGRIRLFKSYRKDFADGEQKRDFIYIKDCIEVMWWLLTHADVNGLFNLGTGIPRSWNHLAEAVFAAMGQPPRVDYIDMPESLRGGYQYFTKADMMRLNKVGCPLHFHSLEESVQDYVVNHLQAETSRLSSHQS